MSAKDEAFINETASKLIEQMKNGTARFLQPWDPSLGDIMPMNPTSRNFYRGINSVILLGQGRTDTRWLTYNQAKDLGYQVRRDEKSVTLLKYMNDKEVMVDGKKVRVPLERPFSVPFHVFSCEQMDNVPPMPVREPPKWNPDERLEMLICDLGVQVSHGGNRAYYRPSLDSVTLPPKEAFPTLEAYSSVLLHECGHWSGHKSRLDRDLSGAFGSEKYAREELVAEISSLMLGTHFSIPHDPSNHASYVKSWIKILEDDPKEIFRAAAKASKVKDFITSRERTWTLQQEQLQQQEQIPDHAYPSAADTLKMVWVKEVLERVSPDVTFDDLGLTRTDSGSFTHFELGGTQLAAVSTDDVSRESLIQALHENLYAYDFVQIPPLPNGWPEIVVGHAQALDWLHTRSSIANTGYDPIDSYKVLQKTALEQGAYPVAMIDDGAYMFESLSVRFIGRDGEPVSNVRTSIGPDGKCLTSVNGDRVPGTHFSSDEDSIENDLKRAIATPAMQQEQQVIVEQPVQGLPEFAIPELTGPFQARAAMLPKDWNGRLSLQACVMADGEPVFALPGEQPTHIAVYAYDRAERRVYLGDLQTQVQANQFVSYLSDNWWQPVSVLEWSAEQAPLHDIDLSAEWAIQCEHLRTKTLVWPAKDDAIVVRDRLLEAARQFSTGQWDTALRNLKDASSFEARQKLRSTQTGMRDLVERVSKEWAAWQLQNGLGPSITPKMKREFEGIPKNLGELASPAITDQEIKSIKAKSQSKAQGRGRAR